jgi:hypothetical protein
LLLSSIAALRARGLEEAYFAQLPSELHHCMRSLVAGTWLDLDVAIAHYGACRRLDLTKDQIEDNGREVGRRVQLTVLHTLTRLATGAGVTPWTVIPLFPTLTARMWQGGGSTVDKVGPKDVIIEVVQNPLMSNSYFRNSYRGVIAGALELRGGSVPERGGDVRA